MWLEELAPLYPASTLKKDEKKNPKQHLHLDLNELLRCHGRLDNTKLTQAAKYPKLLPKSDHYKRIVVTQELHRLW